MKRVILATLLIAPFVFASEGGGHSSELFWKTVNTVILFVLLAWVIKKWGVPFFEGRRNSIKDLVEEAQRAQQESLKALQEAEAKLEDANNKFVESLKIAEETAKKEREMALKEAREMAERIKEQAKETVQVEIRRGENELRRYAVKKALEISEKVIKEKVNPDVEKEIIQKTLKAIS